MGQKFVESLSKRTDVFNSSGFEGWKFKMLTAARATNPKAHEVMEQAKLNLDREFSEDIFSTDLEKNNLNRKLYFVLREKTEGEAFDVVRRVTVQNGAEAWRRLLVRFQDSREGNAASTARGEPTKDQESAGYRSAH